MTVSFPSLRARFFRIGIILVPILFAVALAITWAPRADASLYVWFGDKIAFGADVITHGQVLDEQSIWDHGRILTTVRMSVEGTLKGVERTTVTFRVPGGRVGDIRMKVSTAPEFTVGERSMVFLKATHEDPTTPTLHVYGGAEGKVPIQKDASGNDTVAWYRPDVGRVDVVPLETLRQHLREVLATHLLDSVKRSGK